MDTKWCHSGLSPLWYDLWYEYYNLLFLYSYLWTPPPPPSDLKLSDKDRDRMKDIDSLGSVCTSDRTGLPELSEEFSGFSDPRVEKTWIEPSAEFGLGATEPLAVRAVADAGRVRINLGLECDAAAMASPVHLHRVLLGRRNRARCRLSHRTSRRGPSSAPASGWWRKRDYESFRGGRAATTVISTRVPGASSACTQARCGQFAESPIHSHHSASICVLFAMSVR